jgi:hypothetical protein
MTESDLRGRVESLIQERNYVAAYERVRRSGADEGDKVDLTGEIANAIVAELDASRGTNSPERTAFLRAQLAWVCREVPALSLLYREQLRSQRPDFSGDLLQSLRDIAQGRPADAFERAQQGVKDLGEELRSPDTQDQLNSILKGAEQGIRDGVRQFGNFFDEVAKRGAEIRSERTGNQVKAADDQGKPIEIKIEKETDK